MPGKWTEERKRAWSERQKKTMNRPSVKRKISAARRRNREEGLCKVNIEQMASDEAYRDYQREYRRLYYADPDKRESWKEYMKVWRLKKKGAEELRRLKDWHESHGHVERAEFIARVLDSVENC